MDLMRDCGPSPASSSDGSKKVVSKPLLVGRKKGAASGAFGASLGLLRALMASSSARCFQCDSDTRPLRVIREGAKGSTALACRCLARLGSGPGEDPSEPSARAVETLGGGALAAEGSGGFISKRGGWE